MRTTCVESWFRISITITTHGLTCHSKETHPSRGRLSRRRAAELSPYRRSAACIIDTPEWLELPKDVTFRIRPTPEVRLRPDSEALPPVNFSFHSRRNPSRVPTQPGITAIFEPSIAGCNFRDGQGLPRIIALFEPFYGRM